MGAIIFLSAISLLSFLLGAIIFLSAISLLSFLFWFFIIKPYKKRVEEQQKRFDFIKNESENILKEKGIDAASKFIEENISELIEMPLNVFYGRRFKRVREFLNERLRDYNDDEIDDFVLRGKYRDDDIKKFSMLIKECLLNYCPA